MVMRKALVIVLLTFCLTSILFMIRPVASPEYRPYDPWSDLDDDGHIGPMDLNTLLVHYGSSGEPINKTALLLELQSKIGILNVSVTQLQTDFSLNQTKIIRFIEPNETITPSASTWFDAATFVWTPTNSTSNAVLNIYYYAEYKGTRGQPTYPFIRWRLRVNGVEYWDHRKEVWTGDPYAWTPLQSIATNQNPSTGTLSEGVVPNKAAYEIKFQIMGYDGIAYFRNIHVMMEVVDG